MLKRPLYSTIILFLCILLVPYLVITHNHIGEDCFISFRYVENFVSGHGLVYNTGERVEGYSDYLWVMILSLFRWIGFSPILVSKFLGLVSTILLVWVGSYYSLKKLQRKIDWIYLAAPLLLFFNPILHYHAGRGLETSFYTLLFIWAAFSFKRRNYANSSFAFAAMALLRPEGFIYFWLLVPMLFLDIAYSRTEKFPYSLPWVRFRFFAPYLTVVIGFIIWRLVYYGALFPNSVYAKTDPLNFLYNPSLHMLLQFIISWSYIPLFALLAVFTYHKEEWEIQRSLVIPILLGGGVLFFTIAIGQVQAEPFQHYMPLVPILIILVQEFLRAMKMRVEDNLPLIIGFFVMFQLLNFYTSDNLDAPRSRLHSRTFQFLSSWNFPARLKWYVDEQPILLHAEAGKWCRENLPADALIGADQIGQFGYYSGQRILDLLGLTDPEFARRGYSVELLLSRKPQLDYLVLMGFLGEKRPLLYPIADSFEKPAFKERYQLRWILRPKNTIDKTEFLIYARKDLLAASAKALATAGKEVPPEPEIIHIGPDTEEWLSRIRV